MNHSKKYREAWLVGDLTHSLQRENFGFHIVLVDFQNEAILMLKDRLKRGVSLPEAIIVQSNLNAECLYHELIGFVQGIEKHIPIVVVDAKFSKKSLAESVELGAADYLTMDSAYAHLWKRIDRVTAKTLMFGGNGSIYEYRVPRLKRLFDICVSGSLLLMLSPLFLVLIILIRMESRGPAFYWQPRVGTGYRIFKFFKFRSMRQDADQLVDQLQKQNLYGNSETEDKKPVTSTGPLLVKDDMAIPESQYQASCEEASKNSFFKIKDDPRITRVGKFIRNNSIDELPQLWNVLIGDMSLVGNRPLPLYEAEKLTDDQWSARFMAPAGITGLWQVTERGKSKGSEESRKALDVEYAQSYSFINDLKILIKTPLAALQQDNL
jgi:lipopolysaccharide/colanic/teichoic acid biosynthesis glycosyltransferase